MRIANALRFRLFKVYEVIGHWNEK